MDGEVDPELSSTLLPTGGVGGRLGGNPHLVSLFGIPDHSTPDLEARDLPTISGIDVAMYRCKAGFGFDGPAFNEWFVKRPRRSESDIIGARKIPCPTQDDDAINNITSERNVFINQEKINPLNITSTTEIDA